MGVSDKVIIVHFGLQNELFQTLFSNGEHIYYCRHSIYI